MDELVGMTKKTRKKFKINIISSKILYFMWSNGQPLNAICSPTPQEQKIERKKEKTSLLNDERRVFFHDCNNYSH